MTATASAATDIVDYINEVGQFFGVPIVFLTGDESGEAATPESLLSNWRQSNMANASLFSANDMTVLEQLYVIARENNDMPSQIKTAAQTAFLEYAAAVLSGTESNSQQIRAVHISSKGITPKILKVLTTAFKNLTPNGVTDSYTLGSFKQVPKVTDAIREQWLQPAYKDLASAIFGFEGFPEQGRKGLAILTCRAGTAGMLTTKYPKVMENIIPYQDWALAAAASSDKEIAALFTQANEVHLQQIYDEIRSIFPSFDAFPVLARDALVDITRIDSIENMRGSFIRFVSEENWFMAAQRSKDATTNTDALWNDKTSERFFDAYEQARLERIRGEN